MSKPEKSPCPLGKLGRSIFSSFRRKPEPSGFCVISWDAKTLGPGYRFAIPG
ncbi:MAG: hypothetical protein OJF61_000927 [Rhodanobacteraceae bacterium]|nr:MAG: hypothetical protein OJF61_000927 [Rhodanobacteraceae bacterium]